VFTDMSSQTRCCFRARGCTFFIYLQESASCVILSHSHHRRHRLDKTKRQASNATQHNPHHPHNTYTHMYIHIHHSCMAKSGSSNTSSF